MREKAAHKAVYMRIATIVPTNHVADDVDKLPNVSQLLARHN